MMAGERSGAASVCFALRICRGRFGRRVFAKKSKRRQVFRQGKRTTGANDAVARQTNGVHCSRARGGGRQSSGRPISRAVPRAPTGDVARTTFR